MEECLPEHSRRLIAWQQMVEPPFKRVNLFQSFFTVYILRHFVYLASSHWTINSAYKYHRKKENLQDLGHVVVPFRGLAV